jgi:mRNA deadenylase 3'-5' endonuclease subunit Ccr4
MEGEVRRFVESLPYEKFFDDRLHESCGYGGIIYREGV